MAECNGRTEGTVVLRNGFIDELVFQEGEVGSRPF